MDRDLDLSLLRTFFTIAMTGSFTAAGHRLFRTQPAISLRIKRLEDMIGSPLITRSTDGVSLTHEGNLLLGYAKRMLSLNDDVLRRLKGDTTRDVVRLGLPEEYATLRLDPVLRTFHVISPTATVTIDVRKTIDLANDLKEGRLDIILCAGLADIDHTRHNLRLNNIWVIGETAHLPTMPPLRLVLPPEGNLFRHLALTALDAAEATWDIVCTASNWASARSAILGGLGLSVIPRDMLAPGMRQIGGHEGLPPLPDMTLSLTRRSGPVPASVERLAMLLDESLFAADSGPPITEFY